MKEMLPLLEQVAHAASRLLINAEEAGGEALATLVVNKLRGTLASAPSRPGLGDRRKPCSRTSRRDRWQSDHGRPRDEARELKLEDLGPRQEGGRRQGQHHGHRGRGKSKAIEADQGSSGRRSRRRPRTTTGKSSRSDSPSSRRGRHIKVGATETEMRRRRRGWKTPQRTARAVEEGIVHGGGVALLRASEALGSLKLSATRRPGGHRAARLEEPIRQIVYNAGLEASGSSPRSSVPARDAGLRRRDHTYVDMMKAGSSPTKVERVALQNAASIASLLSRPKRSSPTSRTPGKGRAPMPHAASSSLGPRP